MQAIHEQEEHIDSQSNSSLAKQDKVDTISALNFQ